MGGACPATAGPGVARTLAHFVAQFVADAPADAVRALQGLRDEQVAGARTVVGNVVALHR